MSVGIEVAVVDRLAAITAVTNITSNIRVDHLIPSDTYPAIVVTMTSEEPIDEVTDGLTEDIYSTIEVQCIAETKPKARNLEWAARYGILTQTGTAAGLADYEGTLNGKQIKETTWQGTTTSINEPDDGNAIPLYIVTGTYRVWGFGPA